LNIAAFNIGIAGGAWLGGYVVEGMGLMNTPWIGGVIVLSALLLTRFSASLDNRQTATA
jgi:predicted MFS family arabinose efflux permease